MIIEPQFQLFSESFALIEVSRIQAGRMVDGKQDGFVIIYSLVFFGIGAKFIFGGEVNQKFINQIGKK